MQYNSLEMIVLVENLAAPPLVAEHGLSLLLRYHGIELLFDTGAGSALIPNCTVLGVKPELFKHVVLSHGHNDHTGALSQISGDNLWHSPGITTVRFSRHPGKPIRELSMPAAGADTMRRFLVHEIPAFTEIQPGMFLTGPIPRQSGENCGGPFFLDATGEHPDGILDEQALLLDCGVLIQGCCHAGIINTLQYCRRQRPDLPIHTIVGGLHLQHADENRLRETAHCLKTSGIRSMKLMHCTGKSAIDFLRNALPDCEIEAPHAGATIRL